MLMLLPRSQHVPITTAHLTMTECHLHLLDARSSSMSNLATNAPRAGTLVPPPNTTKHISFLLKPLAPTAYWTQCFSMTNTSHNPQSPQLMLLLKHSTTSWLPSEVPLTSKDNKTWMPLQNSRARSCHLPHPYHTLQG